jgi:hypothetical protein
MKLIIIQFSPKGRIFQDTEDIQKMWRWNLNLFHNTSSKNVSNSGRQHRWAKCIAAQAISRKFTGMKLAIIPLRELRSHTSYTRVYPKVSGLSHNEINNYNNKH